MMSVFGNTTRIVVGVSDARVSDNPDDLLITHSLGSCIGVAIHDPVAMVGGLLHFQLPKSEENVEKALANPCVYADTGIPLLFRTAYALGGSKKRFSVYVAGGARVMDRGDFFNIGQRNHLALKKVFWKNGVFTDAEDVGGEGWRTMSLEMATGRVVIKKVDGEYQMKKAAR